MKRLLAILPLVTLFANAQELTITAREHRLGNGVLLLDVSIPEEGSYRVQTTGRVGINSWTTLANFEAAAAGIVSVSELMRNTARFYRAARLTNPPVILLQPLSSTNFLPVEIKLTTVVSGSAPLRLQWYIGDRVIDDATSTNLSFTGRTDLSGEYRLVASNPWGAVTSSVARIQISTLAAPSISGESIRFVITSAEGDFLSSGNFTSTFNPAGFFTSTGSSIFLNDSGFWLYELANERTARIALPGAILNPDGLITLQYTTGTSGNYSLTVPGRQGFQLGTFELLD